MFKSTIFSGASFLYSSARGVRYYSTKRLTNLERNSFSVSPNLHEIIIGTSLGDLNISKNYTNARLNFEQGLINEAYITHLYDLFKDYCNSPLINKARKPDYRTGKVYTRVYFNTYSLPCFNYYHELFYVNGVKVIPLNLGELLTPIGLAYWAMDDGAKTGTGFRLNTQSYSKDENLFLIKVLKDNFDLNCTLHIHSKDLYRIYISSKSMNKFRNLVSPYFHDSMLYKLNENDKVN
jgi:hypothetical protein